jgi:hypothetical protein
MQTVTIPIEEYQNLKQMAELMKDQVLLKRINSLIDIMYEQKYGLYMKDFTDDLTEQSIINGWTDEPSEWDKL